MLLFLHFHSIRARLNPTTQSQRPQSTCAACSMRDWCFSGDAVGVKSSAKKEVARQSLKIKRGESVFQTGHAFRAIYAIRSGSFKTSLISNQGAEKVMGFFLAGELLGMDAIGTEVHNFDAIALEDSSVCTIPFANLEEFTRTYPVLQHRLHKLISKEILRDRNLELAATVSADQRVASFLVWLSQKHAVLGYSSKQFVLRMKREEIGSYLGLTGETVIRALARLKRLGFIAVKNRNIEVIDAVRLEEFGVGLLDDGVRPSILKSPKKKKRIGRS